jgi:hypothetical protein
LSPGLITDGFFYQIRPGDKDANLFSAITRSEYSQWDGWEETTSGRRGVAYEEKKRLVAREITERAADVFGPLKNLRVLDVFTPLTVRDYVNCPWGSCYGVMRSADQLLKIVSVGRLSVKGLFSAGQNKVAPGLLGCILGSFQVAAEIAGVPRFTELFRQAL